MSEENVGLPATQKASDPASYIPAGLHVLVIHSIKPFRDDKGIPKKDKHGNPGLEIEFAEVVETPEGSNKFKKTGNTARTFFYYSELPPGDPNRNCPSEWKLAGLKKALKIPEEDTSDFEKVRKIKIWGAIKKVVKGDSVFHEPAGKFFPFEGLDKKPALEGDPTLKQYKDNPGGIFYEERADRGSSRSSRGSEDTPQEPYEPPADEDEF